MDEPTNSLDIARQLELLETARALAQEGAQGNFTDMIADETVCTDDPEQLMNYLSEVGHPVLSMEPFDM